MKNTQWLRKSFPPKSRSSSILIEADNVLEPAILKELLRMIFSIRSLKNAKGELLWEKKCERTSLKSCTELSVLEGFTNTDGAYDTVTLAALSNIDAVISILNMKDKTSHITGAPFQPNATLGSLTYSGDGKITGAKALLLTLVGVNTGTVGSSTSGEEAGDKDSLLFEQLLIDLVNNGAWGDGLKVYPFTQRSFGDLVTATEDDDFSSLVAGSLLIFTYVCVNLGKFNSVEQRVWLSVAGILAVAMGTASSLGVCQLLGFPWSQMNNLLPFLMLGVGIDDMFVIMQSWENLTGEEKQHDLITRFGITMRHAGVAVTITSVTDLFAFAIGATSVMPGLQSFCIYAALGIFFIYIFQCTFFLGWFVLDQKRLEETRDSCTCAVKRGDWKPWQCSQMSYLKVFCEQVATALVFPPLKLVVVLGTFVLLVFSVNGVSQLERNFDAGSFIDKGTYLRNYMDASAKHFPTSGDSSRLYMTNLTYARDLEKIGALSSKMNSLGSIEKLDSWYPAFINYVNRIRKDEFGDVLVPKNAAYSEDKFRQDIVAFLADPDGLTYRNDFEFPRSQNSSSPSVLLSSMKFNHISFSTTAKAISGMQKTFEAIESFSFSSKVFATSEPYTMWIMIDIITEELVRNVALALLAVFLCSLILIMDLATSLLVLLAVALTIIDTAGFLQFWGLYLDQDLAIFLTISIGLSVDYSAHIGHSFMVQGGSRDERMVKTLTNIGPAVLNGGFSTFCAFVLLAFSKSQTYLVFFKVFFLVVLFGLFHGLVFLPVILSLVGPKSQTLESEEEVEEPKWAEKSLSIMAVQQEEEPRRKSFITVEEEARMMFDKQRKASVSNFSRSYKDDREDDLKSVSGSEHSYDSINDMAKETEIDSLSIQSNDSEIGRISFTEKRDTESMKGFREREREKVQESERRKSKKIRGAPVRLLQFSCKYNIYLYL